MLIISFRLHTRTLVIHTKVSGHVYVSAATEVFLIKVPFLFRMHGLSNGPLDMLTQLHTPLSEHVLVHIERADLEADVSGEELGQDEAGDDHGVDP